MTKQVWHMIATVPVKRREHSPEWGCDLSRVVGYREKCSCGERGPVKRSVRESREWRSEHLTATDS